ncbi:MAG: DUF4907 domain-containing protein [Chitinophagaceae bacterium]
MKHLIQTTKKNWVYILFTGSFLFFIYTFFYKSTNSHVKLTYKVVKLDSVHFGYEIYTNDTLFIKQATIPSLQGYKLFSKEKDAEAVANLVIEKMLKKQLPTVDNKELDSLQITY